MEIVKLEDINENTNSFWKSLSTLSQKQNDSLQISGPALARQAILNLEEYHLSTKPICRENEAKQIEEFIVEGIKMGGRSQTLYIAGMPGIGKTLTVASVIDNLKQDSEYSDQFKSYYLNAMAFKHPTKIYKSLLYKLFKVKGVSKSKQVARLDYLFTTFCETKVRVIILDELDYLMTKDENVLYNLFEWAQNPNSKLIFIAISNTMNLPELLKQRTYSRMGDCRIAFKSYSKDQIYRIVVDRLKNTEIFDKETLRYACTKLSTFSCDIRKILFILRKTLKIYIEKSNSQLVQIQHVQLAFNETVRNKPECTYIRSLPRNNQLVLICLALSCQSSQKTRECTLSSVNLKIATAYPSMSFETINRIAINLKQAGLLEMKNGVVNHTVDTIVQLKISNIDIKESIYDEELSKLLQLLQV